MTGGTGIFHPGRQHSWQTALALQDSAALQWFATALLYHPDRWPYRVERWLPAGLRGRAQNYFQKVACPELDADAVRIVGAREWAERLAAKLDWPGAAEWLNRTGNSRFQHGVRRLTEREPVARLWGYDTSCADVFEAARKNGTTCVLDRTIGHPRYLRGIIGQERAAFPEFFVGRIGVPSDGAIDEADREIAHASHIVVGSQFCADTLIQSGARADRVHIVPYGYDTDLFAARQPERPGLGRLPVRFLFVGTVSARKGVHHLFDAFAGIPREHATLTVVGPLAIPKATMARYADRIDYLGPLSRAAVAAQMAQAHCFIFPSLFEGSAVVLGEAIAAGLGIVQSHAAGDGVDSGPGGANGMELAQVSAKAIRAAVEQILEQPQILQQWAAASWALRPQRSWQAYRRRIADLLPSLVG